jgi:energy-coupling factor transport system substrate-specific component
VSYKYTTKDIVTLIVIGVIFGIVSTANGFLFNVLFVFPYGNIISGFIGFLWYIAGPLAIFLVRKPGMAFLGEVLMGVISTVTGHPAGIAMLAWCLLEGIGAELPFLLTRYKNYGLGPMLIGAELAGAFSYWWGVYFYGTFQYGSAAVWYPYFAFLSTAWLGGLIAYYIGRALSKTGVVGKDKTQKI